MVAATVSVSAHEVSLQSVARYRGSSRLTCDIVWDVARKPANFEWLGFTEEQIDLLNTIDFVGNNAWARTSQTAIVMPKLLGELAASGVGIGQVVEAMRAIGYHRDALHQLERWESKRTTGRFGP